MSRTRGQVFDIKHYAVHDGPGIRITIFLKGCPLNCVWCHSPESQSRSPEILTNQEKCIGCGNCVKACPVDAVKGPGEIDREACNVCGACAEVCYANAIEIIGREKTIEQVLAEVKKDRELLMVSGGGVTLSGGEPMAQPEFTLELLKHLKQEGYHTALDTSGYAPWVKLKQALDYTDLVLYDLKHMDSSKHQQYTGVKNELILENLDRISGHGKRIWVRVPLIPGVNDDEKHIKTLIEYVRDLNVERTFFLPYHEIGVPKYEALNRVYDYSGEPHSLDRLKEIKKQASEMLDNVVVMGIE